MYYMSLKIVSFYLKIQQVKHELEKESKAHAGAVEENIHLKAQIDQLQQRILNLESKVRIFITF